MVQSLRNTHRASEGFGGCLLNEEELVDLALAREEGLPVHELAHDAPDGPHVHGLPVARGPEQQLWRAVPESEQLMKDVRNDAPWRFRS